jgi:RHH-type proline utilization regulon transcriptional repressor/proline dehydrogenase/delta 1-pyrroline-5-carboxylate dehydrogenase
MLYQNVIDTSDVIRQQIRQHYRCDESEILQTLLPVADVGASARARIWERARLLVTNIRQVQLDKGGVDALLGEFSLSTEEGVVLMCLAEALLRVPDKRTADRLIRDKLSGGDWSSHLGNSESLFVNASAWGLLLTGKMTSYRTTQASEQINLLKRTVGRLGEPVIRRAVRYAMQIMGTQFVLGTNIQSALKRARDMEAKGYRYSYDMLGEGARTMADADRYFESYMMAIEKIGKEANGRGPLVSPGISVKLSAIHPRYEFANQARVMTELVPRLKQLALSAKQYDINFTVDAEEADRLDISLDVIAAVFSDPELADWDGFGLAVQAYQKRALFVIEWLRELTKNVGRKMMVRLVKGAYWDSEIKWSQVDGLPEYPVFTRKPATDVSYQACALKMLEYRDTLYPQFATHNAYTVATILDIAQQSQMGIHGFEFQRLHGMGDALYDQIVGSEPVSCRIYAPVGEHEDLLAYLVRRLLENGANSSFVNNIVDETVPVESLLIDPVEQVMSWKSKRNQAIPLPVNVYGEARKNAQGIDLTDTLNLAQMKTNMDAWFSDTQQSLLGSPVQTNPVLNPANRQEVIGYLSFDDAQKMKAKLDKVSEGFATWADTEVQYRAELLNKIADTLEENQDELLALCIKEAGKTIPDSIAEVREAVDFCRYYAAQVETLFADPTVAPRGVVLCISPWNFPLAIFLGQVVAALVTGNTVIAKPAEQTSLVASRALELMQSAGLPEYALQLVFALGKDAGETLVPDERIKAVMFTGSTETAQWINKTLADRKGEPVPVIAETGGQNAMIADSTALPEQLVDDVITSGFQSAGQRCSAMRVLFVQEDIADKVADMIIGAMEELVIADPAWLSTDIGPVIDEKAKLRLEQHIEYLDSLGSKAKCLHRCGINSQALQHTFFAPALYEIDDLSLLQREVFGPIVHIIRFKADELPQVMAQINGTGYGLTLGVHSRIAEVTRNVAAYANVGNVYVNRNMIGAVVGVQPFGGMGLSGTGPKAGGPHYLSQLITRNHTALSQTQQLSLPQATLEVVGTSVQEAHKAYNDWRGVSVVKRISALQQVLARLPSQLPIQNGDEFAAKVRKQLKIAEQYLSSPETLPGPTGELNQLYLQSRGVMAQLIDGSSELASWLQKSIQVIAAGNALVLVADEQQIAVAEQFQQLMIAAGVSPKLLQVVENTEITSVLDHHNLCGVLVDNDSQWLVAINQQLAARQGALLPMITNHPESLFERLLLEKTITIDTTAAGGNASLMTMSEEHD